MLKLPKSDKKYSWTYHAAEKMRQYGIGEGRVKRIIRFPKRVEEGIASKTVAVMQPAGSKRYSEVWVMYKLLSKSKVKNQSGRIKIITAWRYPGKSPERDPVPEEVIREVRALL